MNISNLEKATKLLSKLKTLDAEIIEIDKFALTVANSETKVSFELKCEDLTKAAEESEKVKFDEDGSIIKDSQDTGYRSLLSSYLIGFKVTDKNENKNQILLKNELSVNITMQILGTLLCQKQDERTAIINKLKNIGFNI